MVNEDWDLGYVLPNLVLRPPSGDPAPGDWPQGLDLGTGIMAIVGQDDARARKLAETSEQVARLVSGFRDGSGRPYPPALLIVKSDADERVRRDLAAYTGFRNAIAFAVILRARAASGADAGATGPSWADTFAFHSGVITESGRLALITDAQRMLYSDTAPFVGSPSSAVSMTDGKLYVDHYLYRALGIAWNTFYSANPAGKEYYIRLFRSLEVATAAASLADANHGSLTDYGTNMALWVSALEILAWPLAQKANLRSVSDLLGQFRWPGRFMSHRRFRVTWRDKVISGNVAQKTYWLMYEARNHFLHGNPVTAAVLSPRLNGEQIHLPMLASSVYRTGLAAYLQQRIPAAEYPNPLVGFEMFDRMRYESSFEARYRRGRREA